jgi:hypothetical protein
VAAPTTAFAPASLAGRVESHTITSATGSLPAKGSEQFIFAASSNHLIVTGVAPVRSAPFDYTYARFGPNLGIVRFTNETGANGFTTLLYTSATKGSFVTTFDSSPGSQHGATADAPAPAATLAPSSLAGRTLNNLITNGTAPFAAKGASTMILAASTYTLAQTTPIANSTGSYTYEVLTPTIACIYFDDSSVLRGFNVLTFTAATKASYVLANLATAGWQRGTTNL